MLHLLITFKISSVSTRRRMGHGDKWGYDNNIAKKTLITSKALLGIRRLLTKKKVNTNLKGCWILCYQITENILTLNTAIGTTQSEVAYLYIVKKLWYLPSSMGAICRRHCSILNCRVSTKLRSVLCDCNQSELGIPLTRIACM